MILFQRLFQFILGMFSHATTEDIDWANCGESRMPVPNRYGAYS